MVAAPVNDGPAIAHRGEKIASARVSDESD
jgi:hypothetical protein